MKKRLKIIVPVVCLAGILCIVLVLIIHKKNIFIPKDYIAVFHGGVGEMTHQTYIYKTDNGRADYGFEYINVESTTVHWGSPNWNHRITEKGKLEYSDEAFGVAEENGAYSFVIFPNDNTAYSIEEVQNGLASSPSMKYFIQSED